MNINIPTQSLFWSAGLKRMQFRQHSRLHFSVLGIIRMGWITELHTHLQNNPIYSCGLWMHEMNQTDLPAHFCLHPTLSCFVLMLDMFSFREKLSELRREKQKLVEKIMDQYRVLEPSMQPPIIKAKYSIYNIYSTYTNCQIITRFNAMHYQQASLFLYIKAVKCAVDLKQL